MQTGIAHINNPAGVAGIIAAEQALKGLKTHVFTVSERSKQFFPEAEFVSLKLYNPFSTLMFLKRLKSEFHLWHYHYPYGRLWRMIRRASHAERIKVLYHFHGTDLRAAGHYDDFCLVSTPDLLPLAPNGVWLPNPIPVERIAKYKGEYAGLPDIPKVIYYPDPAYENGVVDYVTQPLKMLEASGKIQLVAALDFTNDRVLQEIASSNILIGKIRPDIGWFGKFELEGMANGVPVVTYVSDELYHKYHPPVCRTTKETVKADIERLLDDPPLHRLLSQQGYEYIKRYHNTNVVMGLLSKYYEQL